MNRFKLSQIAPCGMNCGICMAFLRDKIKCPGCRESNKGKQLSVRQCIIPGCPRRKRSRSKYCFSCEVYPCARLKRLDKRYRAKYHMSMLENLAQIKKDGIRKFVKNESQRWACPECNGTINVHRGICHSCGVIIWKD